MPSTVGRRRRMSRSVLSAHYTLPHRSLTDRQPSAGCFLLTCVIFVAKVSYVVILGGHGVRGGRGVDKLSDLLMCVGTFGFNFLHPRKPYGTT